MRHKLPKRPSPELKFTVISHRQKSKIVGEIVQYCGLCPLAIRSTCSTIRSGLIEPQVIRYNLKIGSEKGGLTNALQVNNCLKETFNSLKEDYQKKFIRLTVFKTAKFDEQAACMVLGETTMAHTLNDLLAMKTRHFVEIVDAEEYSQKVKGISTIDNVYVKRQLRYSLHPLVYMFLQEVIKGGKFKEEIKLAKPGFVQHFEDLLLKIGKQMDKNCMKAWKMIEENRKHLISLFLDDSIDTSPCDDMKNRILLCTQKVLIGNLLMGDFHRVNFIDRMIRNSRVNGNQLELMFWKIERASWLYDLDRNELVIRQLIEVQNMMDGIVGKGVAMAPVFGCFYYLKAKLSLRKRQPEEALEDIFMAHKLFNEHRFVRHNYLYHITTIYEKVGQAYMMLEPPDLKNSLLYFSAAFMKASENVEKFNNLDIPGSIASIGRCCYEEGLQEKANGNKIVAKLLFQKSVAYYTKAMALDTQMNLHKIDNYADKLIKRAESYVELGLLKVSGALSDAVKDIKEADMLRRKILQPPSYKSTHTPHLVGRIFLIKAKQEYENKQKMTAINNLWKGVMYYEITRDMIKSGGLHPLQLHMTEYQEIIQEHLWALQQTRDVDKIPEAIKFYNDLNAGKFAEDMRRGRSEKETKKNSEYIPIEDVEAEIMMSGPGQLTVAPTTEETEVEEEDFDNETMEKITLEHYELKPEDRMNFDKLFATDDPDHPDLHPISDEEVSNADDESMEVTGAENVLDITADMGKILSKSDMVGITEENHDEVFNPENESKDETGNELLSTVRRKSSGGRRLSSSDGEAGIKAKRRHFRRKRGSRDASMQKFLDDLDELTSEKARGILKSSKSASKDESFEMEMPVMDYLTIVDTTDKEEKKDILKKMKQIYSSVQEEQEEDIAEDDETIPSNQEDKVVTGKKRHGVESESTEEASHAKSSRDVTVLKIINRACQERTVALDMTRKHGIVTWLTNIINTSGTTHHDILTDILHNLWITMVDRKQSDGKFLPPSFSREMMSACKELQKRISDEISMATVIKLLETMSSILQHLLYTCQQLEGQGHQYTPSILTLQDVQQLLRLTKHLSKHRIISSENEKSVDVMGAKESTSGRLDIPECLSDSKNIEKYASVSSHEKQVNLVLELFVHWKPVDVGPPDTQTFSVNMISSKDYYSTFLDVCLWIMQKIKSCNDLDLMEQTLQWMLKHLKSLIDTDQSAVDFSTSNRTQLTDSFIHLYTIINNKYKISDVSEKALHKLQDCVNSLLICVVKTDKEKTDMLQGLESKDVSTDMVSQLIKTRLL